MIIKMISSKQAREFPGLILPAALRSDEFDSYTAYLGIEDDTPVAMAVANMREVAPEIVSVAVSPKYEGKGFATELISHVTSEILAAHSGDEAPNGIGVSFFNGKNSDKLEHIFEKCGYDKASTDNYYEITADKILTHKKLNNAEIRDRVKSSGEYLPLGRISNRLVKAFEGELFSQEGFAHIPHEKLDENISFYGLTDGMITSCILFFKENNGRVNNALLYQTQKENNGLELVCLLSACSDAIRENLDPDTIIGFLTVNKASETLFNKLFPGVKPVDRVYHYEKDFGEETLDEHSAGFDDVPEFEMLSEEKMVCNKCRHCMGKVLECGIYLQKPDAVLDGGMCPEFAKKR